MEMKMVKELLLQALEHERGGVKLYETALKCAVNEVEAALGTSDKETAQCVACEAVTVAELVDHANWELIGEVAKKMAGADAKVLRDAYAEVEDEEDEHYYHSKGWMRELALESLGLKAVLPPPEERKEVKAAIGAARAEAGRTKMR